MKKFLITFEKAIPKGNVCIIVRGNVNLVCERLTGEVLDRMKRNVATMLADQYKCEVPHDDVTVTFIYELEG